MYKIFTTVLIVMALTSCSVQQRINRHIERAEFLSRGHSLTISEEIIARDTITITVPEMRADSVFIEPIVGDTVYIEKDRLSIKYVKIPGERVYIEGRCEEVIVEKVVEIPVLVNKIVHKPIFKWWNYLWLLLLGAIVYIGHKVFEKINR